MQKTVPARLRRAIKKLTRRNGLQISADDVFLVSYPRSGNTWLRYLLANLLAPTEEWNIVNIGRVVPDIMEEYPKDPVLTQPRILKSHEPFCKAYPRVMYLYRDGRDVAVSYYDFHVKLRGYQEDFATFVEQMLSGKLRYGSWQEHARSWLFNSHSTPIFPICYEKLCADTEKELQRLGDYLGMTWSPQDIEAAIVKSTLEKQQKDFRQYKPDSHWSKGFRGGVKGGPGKWRQVFDEQLNALFWEYAGDVATKLGYPQA